MNHDETDNDPELERYVIAGLQAGERHARVPLALAAGARRRAARQRRAQLATVSTVLVLVGAAGAAAYAGGGIAPAPPAGGAGCAVPRAQSTPSVLPSDGEPAPVAELFLRSSDFGAGWSPPVVPVHGAVGPQAYDGPRPVLSHQIEVVRARDQLGAWGTWLQRVGADPEWRLKQHIVRFKDSAVDDAYADTLAHLLCTERAEQLMSDPAGRWAVVRARGPFQGNDSWSLLVRGSNGFVTGVELTYSEDADVEPGTAFLTELALAAEARLDGKAPAAQLQDLPAMELPGQPAGVPTATALGEGWRLSPLPQNRGYPSLEGDLARCIPAWPKAAPDADPAVDNVWTYRYWDGQESRTLVVRVQRLDDAAADALMATGADCDANTRSTLHSLRRGEDGWHYWLTGDLGIALLRKGNAVATVTSSTDLSDKDKLLEQVAPTILDSLE